ncbi:hypothetical protein DINM_006295 [Dirofilaria immitis]|nr:hypothetical protein [Dirofilaria immitis]
MQNNTKNTISTWQLRTHSSSQPRTDDNTWLMGTYRAVLKYHQRRNCFGYIQQQYSDAPRMANIQVNTTTSGAYNIIRRENLANCGIIQVIVQKVETAPVCSLFEVELTSVEDWNVVQNSSQRIEKLLLAQIQLITVGQTYPIWIAQNLYVYFTVARIETSSSLMQNACLCEFTQVHVKPFYSNPSSLEKNNSRDLLEIQDYCGNFLNRTVARVLPEVLIRNVFLEELDILAVFRLSYDQINSEIITLSTVYNNETGQTAHALFIELSMISSRFAALRDCLKRYEPHHCAFSPRLYQLMNGEYEWISVSPLPKDHIYQLETLEILSDVRFVTRNFNECLRNHLWKTCQYYPIIVPVDGLKVEMNLTCCRIRPHFDEKKNEKFRKCFVFSNDVFPLLQYRNIESVKDRFVQLEETSVNEYIHQAVFSFGEWKNEAVEFSEKAENKQVGCNRRFWDAEIIELVGNKSAGKTTILQFLAEKLLHSHLAVYSECLHCSDWNGKSIEKFQDVLKAALVRLRRRYPSVLFLDDLDFLLHSQDEDVRNVRLERCVELLRNLTNGNDLLIVATACTKRDIIELFSMNAGGRFLVT